MLQVKHVQFTTTSGLIWCHPADKWNLNHRHRAICKMSSKHFRKMSRWQHKVRQTAVIFSWRATLKEWISRFWENDIHLKLEERAWCVLSAARWELMAVSVKTETKHKRLKKKERNERNTEKIEEVSPSLFAYAALLLRDDSAAKIITKKTR